MPYNDWAAERLQGMATAAQELTRLGLDRSRRIDVYRVIEDVGISLMFQPMRELYGALIREGTHTGIMVNNQHPVGLRRYTAAHEFGHWALGHEALLDTQEQVENSGMDPREIAAQAFAGAFLMPAPLLNSIPAIDLSNPDELYQAAVRFGVTYSALLTQLTTVGRITWSDRDRLARKTPKQLKTRATNGLQLSNPWRDVWVVRHKEDLQDLCLSEDDEVHLYLEETPSSGYIWWTTGAGASAMFVDEYISGDTGDAIGSRCVRHLGARATRDGKRIVLTLSRSAVGDDAAGKLVVPTATSDEAILGDARGLAPHAQRLLLAARA